MRGLAAPVKTDPRGPGRHRRHRRRPDHLQHLDHRRPDRRGRRLRASPSTATARRPASAARPTCSRRSASTSSSRPTRSASASTRSASASCSPPSTTRRPSTWSRSARSWRCGRSSTCSARSTNPAGAKRQLLGVSDRSFQETIAESLVSLGCEHAMVVSADDGLDELSIAGPTRVVEVADGGTEEWFVEPDDVGLEAAPLDAIPGGEPAENAEVVRRHPRGRGRARRATSRCSTPAPRSTSAAAPVNLRGRRRARRRRRSIRARRRRCWSGWSQHTNELRAQAS